MPSLTATMPALPDLTLLTGLATPLWLVRAEDGGIVWLNRAARKLKVRGSGKPEVHIVASSSMSMRSRISLGRGTRNGSGSR